MSLIIEKEIKIIKRFLNRAKKFNLKLAEKNQEITKLESDHQETIDELIASNQHLLHCYLVMNKMGERLEFKDINKEFMKAFSEAEHFLIEQNIILNEDVREVEKK